MRKLPQNSSIAIGVSLTTLVCCDLSAVTFNEPAVTTTGTTLLLPRYALFFWLKRGDS